MTACSSVKMPISLRGNRKNRKNSENSGLHDRLAAGDFDREAALLRARVEARAQDPRQVGALVLGAQLFGPADPRGRPAEGFAATVAKLTLADVKRLAPAVLDPRFATIVLAGDFEPAALRAALERRFGAWKAAASPPPAAPVALAGAREPRLVLVDRPGAPQTLVLAGRPVPPLDGVPRAARRLANAALGGGFTSRLNQNLREKHGYSYGANSRIRELSGQPTLIVATSVQTEVTGAALGEIRAELEGLSRTGVGDEEAVKARETERSDVAEALATSASLADALAAAVLAGRPASALADDMAALDATAPAAARAAATGGAFAPGSMTVVLVGDRKAVLPQLERAGWPAGVLSAVKLCHSVSTSGPSAMR